MSYVALPLVRLKPLEWVLACSLKIVFNRWLPNRRGKGVNAWSRGQREELCMGYSKVLREPGNTTLTMLLVAVSVCSGKMPPSLGRSKHGLCGDSHEGSTRA